MLERIWRRAANLDATEAREVVERLGAIDRSKQMMESYKEQAIQKLTDVQNPSLKGLLRRVVSKIFGVEVKGWCSEFEARNGVVADGDHTGSAVASSA